MTTSESLARPGRFAAVPGAPPAPAAVPDAGGLGPDGVWPPLPGGAAVRRARGDPPTVPIPLLAAFPGAEAHIRTERPGPDGEPPDGTLRGVRPGADPSRDGVDRFAEGTLPGARAADPGGRTAAVLRRLAPAGWRGARVDPGRPGATALALVAAAAAVVAAVGVWLERPRAEPVPDLPAVTVSAPGADAPTGTAAPSAVATTAATTAAAPAAPPALLVVSVSGKVRRPGLVEVPDGARVADVLDAAGGAMPGTDLSGLNLARRVADGEQVAVGVPPAPDAAPIPGPGASPAAGGVPGAPAVKVDLNAATVEQLDALPGVGPVTAQRILEWRTQHGRFTRVEQLREIEGIGERRFAQLRELVVV